jgi:hypothetical protein
VAVRLNEGPGIGAELVELDAGGLNEPPNLLGVAARVLGIAAGLEETLGWGAGEGEGTRCGGCLANADRAGEEGSEREVCGWIADLGIFTIKARSLVAVASAGAGAAGDEGSVVRAAELGSGAVAAAVVVAVGVVDRDGEVG